MTVPFSCQAAPSSDFSLCCSTTERLLSRKHDVCESQSIVLCCQLSLSCFLGFSVVHCSAVLLLHKKQYAMHSILTRQVQFAACPDKISCAQRALSSALLSVLSRSIAQGQATSCAHLQDSPGCQRRSNKPLKQLLQQLVHRFTSQLQPQLLPMSNQWHQLQYSLSSCPEYCLSSSLSWGHGKQQASGIGIPPMGLSIPSISISSRQSLSRQLCWIGNLQPPSQPQRSQGHPQQLQEGPSQKVSGKKQRRLRPHLMLAGGLRGVWGPHTQLAQTQGMLRCSVVGVRLCLHPLREAYHLVQTRR